MGLILCIFALLLVAGQVLPDPEATPAEPAPVEAAAPAAHGQVAASQVAAGQAPPAR